MRLESPENESEFIYTIGVRPEWINVKDQLPKDKTPILCFEKSSGMYVATFDESFPEDCFSAWDSGHCCGREPLPASHWMPLPIPPEE